jgi:hypothetical protein
MANNVQDQLSQNDYRQSLVRLVGPALVALITLGQLATGNRFNPRGPAWLDPASLSAVVASAFFYALYYGNTSYVSAQLRNLLSATDSTKIVGTAALPTANKVKRRTDWALAQYIAGYLFLFAAVGFFGAFLWT